MFNQLFETYKHFAIPHGENILNTASDMDMETICAYQLSKYAALSTSKNVVV